MDKECKIQTLGKYLAIKRKKVKTSHNLEKPLNQYIPLKKPKTWLLHGIAYIKCTEECVCKDC